MVRNAQTEVWVARQEVSGEVLLIPGALPPTGPGDWHKQEGDSEEPAVALPYEAFRLVFGQPLPRGALVRMAIQTVVMLPQQSS
jgi:hypothetical protein